MEKVDKSIIIDKKNENFKNKKVEKLKRLGDKTN